jgi:quinol monooxygenase YgiN
MPEAPMPVVMVQLKVKDYASWKVGFDATAEHRKAGGLTNTHVLRSTDDPNEIFVQSDTADTAKAKEFLTSPEVRAGMEKSGVIGTPTIHLLNPA